MADSRLAVLVLAAAVPATREVRADRGVERREGPRRLEKPDEMPCEERHGLTGTSTMVPRMPTSGWWVESLHVFVRLRVGQGGQPAVDPSLGCRTVSRTGLWSNRRADSTPPGMFRTAIPSCGSPGAQSRLGRAGLSPGLCHEVAEPRWGLSRSLSRRRLLGRGEVSGHQCRHRSR